MQRLRGLILTFAFLVFRLPGLLVLPVVTDEANFYRWVQLIIANPADLFVSFEIYNKKPLFTWLITPLVYCDISPLLAGRLLALFFGLASLWLTLILAKKLGGDMVAWAAGILVIGCPFLSFYQRIGLYESLIIAEALGVLLLSYRFVESPTKKNSVLLGALLGLSLITKSYCVVFLFYLPLVMLFTLWGAKDSRTFQLRANLQALKPWLGGAALSFFIALATVAAVQAYPLLQWGKGFWMSAHVFIGQQSGDQKTIADYIFGNLVEIPAYFPIYLGRAVTAAFLAAAIVAVIRKERNILVLISSLVFPALFLVIFSRICFSRYLVHAVPFMLIAVAWLLKETVVHLQSRNLFQKIRPVSLVILFAVIVCIPNIPPLYWLAMDPAHATFNAEDREQYVTSWASGYGAQELNDKLDELLKEGPLDVFVAPFSGTPKDTLLINYNENPKIRVHMCPWINKMPVLFFGDQTINIQKDNYSKRFGSEDLSVSSLTNRVYAVLPVPAVSLKVFLSHNPKARVVWHYRKPGDQAAVVLLKL